MPPYATNPPYPTGTSGGGGTNTNSNPPLGRQDTYGTIQPEHIRFSLLSAVQDKIRARLRESLSIAQVVHTKIIRLPG